jgi:hypothetical protein
MMFSELHNAEVEQRACKDVLTDPDIMEMTNQKYNVKYGNGRSLTLV